MTDEDEDQTIIERIRPSRRSREHYGGPERRQPPQPEYLKMVIPYVIAGASLFATFKVMEYRVDRLERDLTEHIEEERATDKAQWERIAKLLGREIVPQ